MIYDLNRVKLVFNKSKERKQLLKEYVFKKALNYYQTKKGYMLVSYITTLVLFLIIALSSLSILVTKDVGTFCLMVVILFCCTFFMASILGLTKEDIIIAKLYPVRYSKINYYDFTMFLVNKASRLHKDITNNIEESNRILCRIYDNSTEYKEVIRTDIKSFTDTAHKTLGKINNENNEAYSQISEDSVTISEVFIDQEIGTNKINGYKEKVCLDYLEYILKDTLLLLDLDSKIRKRLEYYRYLESLSQKRVFL